MRPAATLDVAPVMAKLLAMLARSPAPQMKYADPIVAERSVRRAIKQGRAFICCGFFIMVDVGCDWYSEHSYLIEQIILRVYDTGAPVTRAIDALDEIAAELGCVAIAVGDTQVGYMTPFYQLAGYKTLGTQLMKERANGVHPQGDGGAGSD